MDRGRCLNGCRCSLLHPRPFASHQWRKSMAVAKIIELNASSPTSVEDAVRTGLAKAAETIKNIQGAWINETDRKSTRLNSSHVKISYAVFCLKKKTQQNQTI